MSNKKEIKLKIGDLIFLKTGRIYMLVDEKWYNDPEFDEILGPSEILVTGEEKDDVIKSKRYL